MGKIISFCLFFTLSAFSEDHTTLRTEERVPDKSRPNEQYRALCGNANTKKEETNTKLDARTLAAYDLLRAKCATCHNPGSTSGAKTFSDILNVDELTRSGLIETKKNPKESILIQRIEDSSMPQDGPELSSDEKKLLTDWILYGAKSFSTKQTGVPDVGFISIDDLEFCMVKDLRTLNEVDRPFIRYIQLGNLYNADRKSELSRTRTALDKLLNSLSWNKEIKKATVIDGTQTLLRIDIRDYGWNIELWNQIEIVNPYKEPTPSAKNKELQDKLQTYTPHIRGDWFVFSASKPPLYHSLLYDAKKHRIFFEKSQAQRSLEDNLSINVNSNTRNGNITKAGFKQSNVTKSNRVIERHSTPYGAYWKSDDFKSRVGDQNIFEHPIDYKRDGGEYIFSLPNKLHGYLVTDANGARLDGVPTDVAVDPLRFHKDGVVVNGVSCMSCHTKGIKRQNDEMLPHFEGIEQLIEKNPNPGLQSLISQVKRVYKNNKTLNAQFSADEREYSDAISKVGGSVEYPDPVHATAFQFEAPLDIKSIAAELDHEVKVVEDLLKSDIRLRLKLAFGSNHTIDRETFNANYQTLKDKLNGHDGPSKDRTSLIPAPVLSEPNIDRHFEFVEVQPGTFSMGTKHSNFLLTKDEVQHLVTITKPYQIQTTEVPNSLWDKVMQEKSPLRRAADLPVTFISWDEVQVFIRRLNALPEVKKTGYSYRLPTEAEWEYAARGGNAPGIDMQTRYSFGDDSDKLPEFAWFSGSSENYVDRPLPVFTPGVRPTPLRLFGIHGNVSELVEDSYQADLGRSQVIDPVHKGDTEFVVKRNGGFDSQSEELTSSSRDKFPRTKRDSSVGFRLVRTPLPDAQEAK